MVNKMSKRKELFNNILNSVKEFAEYEFNEGQETIRDLKEEAKPSLDELKKEIDPFLNKAEAFKNEMVDFINELNQDANVTEDDIQDNHDEDIQVKVFVDNEDLSQKEVEDIVRKLTGLDNVDFEVVEDKHNDKSILLVNVKDYSAYLNKITHLSTLVDELDKFDSAFNTDLLSLTEENVRKFKDTGLQVSEEILLAHLRTVVTAEIKRLQKES